MSVFLPLRHFCAFSMMRKSYLCACGTLPAKPFRIRQVGGLWHNGVLLKRKSFADFNSHFF